MMLDIQLGSSCKPPQEGDIVILPKTKWASVGYFGLIFTDDNFKADENPRMIALLFASSLNKNEFRHKISSSRAPEFIMPVSFVKLN